MNLAEFRATRQLIDANAYRADWDATPHQFTDIEVQAAWSYGDQLIMLTARGFEWMWVMGVNFEPTLAEAEAKLYEEVRPRGMTEANLETADAIADDMVIWADYDRNEVYGDPNDTLIEVLAIRPDSNEISIHNTFSLEEAQALATVLTMRIAGVMNATTTVNVCEKANVYPDDCKG